MTTQKQKLDKTEVENMILKNNIIERAISDLKYAPMWVKVLLVWGGGIVGAALIMAIMNLILVKK